MKGAPLRPFRDVFKTLGPGLITGAADDDPSGIGTYSQTGAQLGYGASWTMLLTFPLMAAIQRFPRGLVASPDTASLATSAATIPQAC
jgi:Mn2+/Fe2+ NRAMP family transporter